LFVIRSLESLPASEEKIACISLDDAGKMRLINFSFEDR
jgi:hypothetical protein